MSDPASGAPQTSMLPPKPGPGSKSGLGTILAAVAIVLALVAIAVGVSLPSASNNATNGTPTINVWAVVNSAGGLARGTANGSTQISTGVYNVFFPQFLDGCSWTVNPGTTSTGSEPSARATVHTMPLATHGVNVTTFYATNSTPLDADFHVVGVCPGGLSANIASNGTYQSGQGVTGTHTFLAGEYEVDFTQDVSQCAYIASLQSGSGSATTASRNGVSEGVWVTTYDASGNLTAAAFTLTVYC